MPDSGNNFQVAKVIIPFEVDPESMRRFAEELARQLGIAISAAGGSANSGKSDRGQQQPPVNDQGNKQKSPENEAPVLTRQDVDKILNGMEMVVKATVDTRLSVERSTAVITRIEPMIAMGGGEH